MKTSDSISELAAALAKAQAVMRPALKDSPNAAFKSKYADLTEVWNAARAPLTDNGISVVQEAISTEEGVGVTTRLIHASGQWIELGPIVVPVSKHDAHGTGSAITYGKRYGLSAAIGIVADVDDDGNAAAKAAPAAIAVDPAELAISLASCQEAAMSGRKALVAVWKKLPDAVKGALSPRMAELGKVADAADAQPQPVEQ